MIEEKENKLEENNISFRAGNLRDDCFNSLQNAYPLCYERAEVSYITSGNSLRSNTFRRIGVVLNGETQARDNFILELGFKSWGDIDPSDPIRKIHYDTMLNFLEIALLHNKILDICVNSRYDGGYRIVDVSLRRD